MAINTVLPGLFLVGTKVLGEMRIFKIKDNYHGIGVQFLDQDHAGHFAGNVDFFCRVEKKIFGLNLSDGGDSKLSMKINKHIYFLNIEPLLGFHYFS